MQETKAISEFRTILRAINVLIFRLIRNLVYLAFFPAVVEN